MIHFAQRLEIYFAHREELHRVWGYYALASIGVLTLDWTGTVPPENHVTLVYAYSIFWIYNAYVLTLTYRALGDAATAVRCTKLTSEGNTGLSEEEKKIEKKVLHHFSTKHWVVVPFGQIVLSILVIWAIR